MSAGCLCWPPWEERGALSSESPSPSPGIVLQRPLPVCTPCLPTGPGRRTDTLRAPELWDPGQSTATTSGAEAAAIRPPGTVAPPALLAWAVSLDDLHREQTHPALRHATFARKGLGQACLAVYANVCKCMQLIRATTLAVCVTAVRKGSGVGVAFRFLTPLSSCACVRACVCVRPQAGPARHFWVPPAVPLGVPEVQLRAVPGAVLDLDAAVPRGEVPSPGSPRGLTSPSELHPRMPIKCCWSRDAVGWALSLGVV